jgi:protein disulfide-isomerase
MGKRKIEGALTEFHAANVEVNGNFQLDASFMASEDDNMVVSIWPKNTVKTKHGHTNDGQLDQNAKNSGLNFHFEKNHYDQFIQCTPFLAFGKETLTSQMN